MRRRYLHLLSDRYTPYDIYVQSTDVDRTLMSAESHLAGLYPPTGNQVWDSIKWMPIPVHTVPEGEDNVLAAKKYCPRYNYELEKVLHSDAMKRVDRENKKLYEYLTEKTGKKVSSLRSIEHLYDTLFIEVCRFLLLFTLSILFDLNRVDLTVGQLRSLQNLYNKTLPEWTNAVFPDKLKPIAAKSFTINAYNKILQRLKSGK